MSLAITNHKTFNFRFWNRALEYLGGDEVNRHFGKLVQIVLT